MERPAEKRTHVRSMRLSTTEVDAFTAAAQRFDMKVEPWMRAVLMKSLLVDPREPEDIRR